jgi:hypothetical protein
MQAAMKALEALPKPHDIEMRDNDARPERPGL